MLRFDSQDLPTVLADEEIQAMVEDQMVVMDDEGCCVAVKGDHIITMTILNKLVELGVDYTYVQAQPHPVQLISPQ